MLLNEVCLLPQNTTKASNEDISIPPVIEVKNKIRKRGSCVLEVCDGTVSESLFTNVSKKKCANFKPKMKDNDKSDWLKVFEHKNSFSLLANNPAIF